VVVAEDVVVVVVDPSEATVEATGAEDVASPHTKACGFTPYEGVWLSANSFCHSPRAHFFAIR
jgi:hypothetical protein